MIVFIKKIPILGSYSSSGFSTERRFIIQNQTFYIFFDGANKRYTLPNYAKSELVPASLGLIYP